MRQPLIAGNWKMNGSKSSAESLLNGVVAGSGGISKTEIAVCVPFPIFISASRLLAGSSVRLGAQNLCTESGGAFTGEVAGSMLADFGCAT
jgi:triosephosphate isomerase (TIM)